MSGGSVIVTRQGHHWPTKPSAPLSGDAYIGVNERPRTLPFRSKSMGYTIMMKSGQNTSGQQQEQVHAGVKPAGTENIGKM